MDLSAWILDAYLDVGGVRLWVIDAEGRPHTFLDRWRPVFYVGASSRGEWRSVHAVLDSLRSSFTLAPVEKKDFFTDQIRPAVEVRVLEPLLFQKTVDRLLGVSSSLFNADIPPVQSYFYERGFFPLARCLFDVSKDGWLNGGQVDDSCWNLDYDLPPLRIVRLGFDSDHGRRRSYVLTRGREWEEGTTFVLDESEEEFIRSLNRHVREWDPDILLTDGGDGVIMPRLQFHADRTGVPLHLSRDPARNVAGGRPHRFFSYGKVHYRAGPRTLFGRLHIDTRNSFMVGHSELEGLFEIARTGKIPLQRAARCTIGTSLSSMQHEWAVRNDYLIPLDKGQTEDFRPGDEFLLSDRGGLIYAPEIGWHEDVIEYDFISMYPEIMIRRNVTPEAVNCVCCPDNKVPEINHHLCRHRRGLIPHVLGPIVEKRRRYKELIRGHHPKKDVFQRRCDAFKWTLVTCFGYLGFRNARFGRIEAHECVNAYGRDALLTAKETAESRGYRFLHAIVDSLWLKKDGASDRDVEDLRKEIERKTGLPLGYEGRYRWIRFCPSRLNKKAGVPNRYFGVMTDGTRKVRGLAVRRHDTPPFIKSFQGALLNEMARGRTLSDLADRKGDIEMIIDDYRDRLRSGAVSPAELALSCRLSQSPSDYRHDTLAALAAKKMEAAGLRVHAGETIEFIVAEEHDKIKEGRVLPLVFVDDFFEYDRAYYERLMNRVIEETAY